MLSVVTSTIQLVAFVAQCFLSTVSGIGQVIYATLSAVVLWLWTAVDGVVTFVRIIHEDNASVVCNQVSAVAAVCREQLSAASEAVEAAIAVASQITGDAASATSAVLGGTAGALWAIASAAVEAAWWLVTFMPQQAPVLLAEVRKALPELTGLLLLWAAWRGAVRGRGRVASVARTCAHSVRAALRWAWWRLRVLGCSELQWLRDTHTEEREDSEVTEGPAVACVVCKERVKCVLTLPCRHVCLCRHCCTIICNYQRTCPICRTFIYHTVNIYL